jgi:hypothetical protein
MIHLHKGCVCTRKKLADSERENRSHRYPLLVMLSVKADEGLYAMTASADDVTRVDVS